MALIPRERSKEEQDMINAGKAEEEERIRNYKPYTKKTRGEEVNWQAQGSNEGNKPPVIHIHTSGKTKSGDGSTGRYGYKKYEMSPEEDMSGKGLWERAKYKVKRKVEERRIINKAYANAKYNARIVNAQKRAWREEDIDQQNQMGTSRSGKLNNFASLLGGGDDFGKKLSNFNAMGGSGGGNVSSMFGGGGFDKNKQKAIDNMLGGRREAPNVDALFGGGGGDRSKAINNIFGSPNGKHKKNQFGGGRWV